MEAGEPLKGNRGGADLDDGVLSLMLEVGLDGRARKVHLASHRA